MSRNSNPVDHKINNKKRVENGVVIATVIAAVIVAVLGLIGTIVAAIIGYNGNRLQVELSIQATQTAEQKVTQLSLIPSQFSPSATETMVSTPGQPTIVDTTIQPIIIATSTTQPMDWSTFIHIVSNWTPCGLRMMPSYINPQKDPSTAAVQIDKAFMTQDYHSWALGPWGKDNGFLLILHIENISQDKDWIKISNVASISVQVKKEVPDQVNFSDIPLCGGTGELNFPPFNRHQVKGDCDRWPRMQPVINTPGLNAA